MSSPSSDIAAHDDRVHRVGGSAAGRSHRDLAVAVVSGAGSTTVAFPSLTERERDVLEMVAVGKGNATIAHELMISLKTVRNHVSNVFTKLQVSDRSAAIVMAREAGLGRPDPARSEPGSPTPRTGASLSET